MAWQLITLPLGSWQLPLATLCSVPQIPITRIKPSACCNSVKIRKFTDAPVDSQAHRYRYRCRYIHPYIHYMQAPLATLPHLPQSMYGLQQNVPFVLFDFNYAPQRQRGIRPNGALDLPSASPFSMESINTDSPQATTCVACNKMQLPFWEEIQLMNELHG